MNTLELIANIVGIVAGLLAAWNSIHNWWVGMIGCALMALMFFQSHLYADTTLHVFMFVTNIFGWYYWLKGRNGGDAPIRKSSLLYFGGSLIAAIVVAALYGWGLEADTNDSLPFEDATVLALSLLAQFLLIGRRIETWYCSLLGDTIGIVLFVSAGLYVTAGHSVILWGSSFIGFFRWRAELRRNEHLASTA